MSGNSEETDNPAGLGVEADLPETGTGAESRHRLHIAEDGVEEARARRQSYGTDGDGETCETVHEYHNAHTFRRMD